jgi:hypothetical protein
MFFFYVILYQQDCLEEKFRLQEENRQLRLQLLATQAALSVCEAREGGDILQLEEEGVVLGFLALLVLGSLASTISRAVWYRSHHRDFPPDR